MPNNVLFLLKNRQTLGLCPQTPFPPADGCSAPRPPHWSSYIVSSFYICTQSINTFGINQKILISCSYSESAPGFRRRKNYIAFRMPQTMRKL